MGNNRTLLVILDGFGIGKESSSNSIQNAKMPFYKDLLKTKPHSQLLTHGEEVGLPPGVMGNSEVGHMTIGSGRILFQTLVRINQAIKEGSLSKNPVIQKTFQAGAKTRLHLMGLISDGGVHSHLDHLLRLLDMAQIMGVPKVSVHCFMDGRDTPPTSSIGFMKTLLSHPAFSAKSGTQAEIATLMGRYYAMDRDKRWDRTDLALAALTGKITPTESDPIQAITQAHEQGETDEFIKPILFHKEAALGDDQAVLFFNFRADRARQLTQRLWEIKPDFPKLATYACMAEYDSKFTAPVVFPPLSVKKGLGEILEAHRLRQFRTAETEKYAHVTFFFNGGREAPFQNEERALVNSPKEVPTYDLKPEMSALQITEEMVKRLTSNQYDFLVVNYANPDMVGHTGKYEAAIKAMGVLDQCLNKLLTTAMRLGYHCLITADHGNAEEMCDHEGRPHTQHTLNPVPLIIASPKLDTKTKLLEGNLSDVMPTLCHLMEIPIPAEVTGKILIK